jgi:dienelactone hydrolase
MAGVLSAAMRTAISIVIALAVVASLHAATPRPEADELDEVVVSAKVPLPIEAFLAHAKFDSVVISPGGTRLVLGWTEDDFRRQLTTMEFPSMKTIDSRFLRTHFGVTDLRWLGERRLLVQAEWPSHGFRRFREFLGTMLIADLDTSVVQVLNDFPAMDLDPLATQARQEELGQPPPPRRNSRGASNPEAEPEPVTTAQGPVRLVATNTGTAEQILIQTTRDHLGDATDGYGAFLLNLQDNTQSQVATLPLHGGQFITGPAHRVALVVGVTAQNERVVYYLPPDARAEGKDWQLLVNNASGERGLVPLAWTGTGEEYYALDGRDGPTRGVVVWDAATNTQRLLYRHPSADLNAVALDPTGKPWMYSGMDQYPVYWYPDPLHPLARLHRNLVARLPHENIEVLNASDDYATAVVRLTSGRRPPVYHIMDVKAAKSLGSLNTYPRLKGTRLAPVDAIEFRASDGLMIHGYLTTPMDADDKPRRHLPLLVIAHDGPEGGVSDYRYEFERQLFASRGYAVLQVNHRGTGGRGVAFERAGDHQWGHTVQDDFADGVRWAIKEGVADANHICFYGTGYGAFSAMVSAARDPNLYQCVIGVSGVYDLPNMLGNGDHEIPPALRQVLGSDMDELKARSPVSQAKAIKAKVMLMYSSTDLKVPAEQSKLMRKALRSAGNSPQWESTDYGGSYFTPATRVDVYKRIVAYLDQRRVK